MKDHVSHNVDLLATLARTEMGERKKKGAQASDDFEQKSCGGWQPMVQSNDKRRERRETCGLV